MATMDISLAKQMIETLAAMTLEKSISPAQVANILAKILSYDEAEEEAINKLTENLSEEIERAKAEEKKKADIYDLKDYTDGTLLPTNGNYVYYERPTHSVSGYYDYQEYIAFCVKHDNEEDVAPNNHYILLFVDNGGFEFYEKFYALEAKSDFEKYVARCFAALPATTENDGLMSSEDKSTFQKIITKLDNIHYVLSEMLSKGVFTDKISNCLSAVINADDNAVCGMAACGYAICGNK